MITLLQGSVLGPHLFNVINSLEKQELPKSNYNVNSVRETHHRPIDDTMKKVDNIEDLKALKCFQVQNPGDLNPVSNI